MNPFWFVAALIGSWLKVSTALSEIVAGAVAQLVIGVSAGGEAPGAKAPWITFLAETGAFCLPAVRAFGYSGHEGIYYSLMMLTGMNHGIIQWQTAGSCRAFAARRTSGN